MHLAQFSGVGLAGPCRLCAVDAWHHRDPNNFIYVPHEHVLHHKSWNCCTKVTGAVLFCFSHDNTLQKFSHFLKFFPIYHISKLDFDGCAWDFMWQRRTSAKENAYTCFYCGMYSKENLWWQIQLQVIVGLFGILAALPYFKIICTLVQNMFFLQDCLLFSSVYVPSKYDATTALIHFNDGELRVICSVNFTFCTTKKCSLIYPD